RVDRDHSSLAIKDRTARSAFSGLPGVHYSTGKRVAYRTRSRERSDQIPGCERRGYAWRRHIVAAHCLAAFGFVDSLEQPVDSRGVAEKDYRFAYDRDRIGLAHRTDRERGARGLELAKRDVVANGGRRHLQIKRRLDRREECLERVHPRNKPAALPQDEPRELIGGRRLNYVLVCRDDSDVHDKSGPGVVDLNDRTTAVNRG